MAPPWKCTSVDAAQSREEAAMPFVFCRKHVAELSRNGRQVKGDTFSIRNSIWIFWRITKQSSESRFTIHDDSLRIGGKISFRARFTNFYHRKMLLSILYKSKVVEISWVTRLDEMWHYVIERTNSFARRAIIFLSFVQIFTLYRNSRVQQDFYAARVWTRSLFEEKHVRLLIFYVYGGRRKNVTSKLITLFNMHSHFPWK